MPIYISRGRFTSDAVKGMLAKPENREEAVAKLFQSVGGRLRKGCSRNVPGCRKGSEGLSERRAFVGLDETSI
jgi:hypothetical protein